MHVFASSSVGSVLSQLPTYAIAQLGFDGTKVLVAMAVILVTAIPAALFYALVMAVKLTPKVCQIIAYVWWIVIIIVFPLVASTNVETTGDNTSYYVTLVGSVFFGIGFGWFYAIENANFLMVTPKGMQAQYVPPC
jgi:MFS-type transporter involved in bile tolerance (Atg22 family)